MTSVTRGRSGHVWVTVLVALVALVVGFYAARVLSPADEDEPVAAVATMPATLTAPAFRPVEDVDIFGSRKLPSSQEVVNFLSQPLPVPEDAKSLVPSLHETMSGLRSAEKGYVMWYDEAALDVTNMAPKDIEMILYHYRGHFEQLFRFTFRTTDRPHELFKTSSGFGHITPGVRTDTIWRQGLKCRDANFALDIDVDMFDFEPKPDGLNYTRLPVAKLTDPVRGQRVMVFRFTFLGQGLKGTGKWPERAGNK